MRTEESDERSHNRVEETAGRPRSEEHTSELQSPCNLVCRLLLEKKKNDHIMGLDDDHTCRIPRVYYHSLDGASGYYAPQTKRHTHVDLFDHYDLYNAPYRYPDAH